MSDPTAEMALMLDALNRRKIADLEALVAALLAALPADEPLSFEAGDPWPLDGYTPEDAYRLGREEGAILLARELRAIAKAEGW